MPEKIINVQDAFLNYIRKNKIPITIYLLNGVKLTGIIACFDHSSIILKRDAYMQLIYKHAISTFSPHGSISIFDWNNSSSQNQQLEEGNTTEDEEIINEDYYENEFSKKGIFSNGF